MKFFLRGISFLFLASIVVIVLLLFELVEKMLPDSVQISPVTFCHECIIAVQLLLNNNINNNINKKLI